MFNAGTTIFILGAIFSITILCYAAFPRRTNNVLVKFIPAWNKRYVVVHIRYPSGKLEPWLIIPNLQGLTTVSKYAYNLDEKYAVLRYEGRLHFIVDEINAIPAQFEPVTKEQVIYNAAEIKTALNNTVMEYLFSRKKELLIMGLFGLAILSILFMVYLSYELSAIRGIVESGGVTP